MTMPAAATLLARPPPRSNDRLPESEPELSAVAVTPAEHGSVAVPEFDPVVALTPTLALAFPLAAVPFAVPFTEPPAVTTGAVDEFGGVELEALDEHGVELRTRKQASPSPLVVLCDPGVGFVAALLLAPPLASKLTTSAPADGIPKATAKQAVAPAVARRTPK
jgi:hypothetical protein